MFFRARCTVRVESICEHIPLISVRHKALFVKPYKLDDIRVWIDNLMVIYVVLTCFNHITSYYDISLFLINVI